MTNLDNDLDVLAEIEKARKEFLETVDVKILDNADNASSFNAIISSKGPIIIK